MTEEKVNQLKAVGFAWIYSDRKAWLEEGGESNEKRKRGRPRKTLKMAATEAAVVAYRGPINLPNKPIRAKWLQMLQKLKDYKERTGSVYVSDEETDEELVLLRLWVKGQKNLYSRMRQGYDVGMTQEKADVSAGKGGLYIIDISSASYLVQSNAQIQSYCILADAQRSWGGFPTILGGHVCQGSPVQGSKWQ